jgi:hypothetical protein
MTNMSLRWTSFQPLRAEVKRCVKRFRPIQLAIWPQHRINAHVHALVPVKGLASFTRRQKFSFGVVLALWPLLAVAILPSDALLNRSGSLCVSALLSEAAASVLFFMLLRRRPKDRLTFWSTIAAAVAGEITLAFLIAALAIITRAS